MSGVDVEQVLRRELGQLGRWQLRTLALLALLELFSGWQAEYVFTAARINTRCLIPECEAGGAAEFQPAWLLQAVPAAAGAPAQCERYAPRAAAAAASAAAAECSAELFDQDTVIPCEEYVYETTDSVVYDFGLACDEWRRTLLGSLRTAGTLLALPLAGLVSDRRGRRAALALSALATALLGAARYWAGSYSAFLALQVAEAALGSGVISCASILSTELVGPKYRVATIAKMVSFFALGQVTLGLIAWAVPDWRQLTLALYLPQLVSVAYFWIIGESIRWYYSTGKYDKAEQALKKIARFNKREFSEKSLKLLRENAEQEKKKTCDAGAAREPWLGALVWRHPAVRRRLCVAPVWWVALTLIYYGLSINSVHLSGSAHVSYILVAAVELPGFWAASLLIDRLGRRPVIAGGFWLCCACQVAYMFIPSEQYLWSLLVYLVGKVCIAGVVVAVYVCTAELFPTPQRHRLFAFCSMLGRVGAIVAPLTPAFGARVPFVLFGGCALLAGALALLVPETRGRSLPDTMQQADELAARPAPAAAAAGTSAETPEH